MEDKDLKAQQEARDSVEAAFRAFEVLVGFDQAKIDSICEAMSRAALAEAERLGQMAHEETGFGRPEDKKEKNRFAAQDVWSHFRDMRTVGVVSETPNIVEIASPRGVVAAIIPSTNPTSTAIFKIIIAIKSRNSIVLSPHPSAAKCIQEAARIMREAALPLGLPADAIKCLSISSIEGTETLMKHQRTAVILATGGTGLVRAAYSSGKPAFGVGPGNVPVFIERSANASKAVADILTGTCFDNGTICASEQSVVVDKPLEASVRDEFRRQGGHFLSPIEAEKVAAILLTPQRTLNAGIVGRSAKYIADLAGVSIPDGTRCLIADCGGVGRDFPWSIEKLSPTLAFFVVDGIDAGAARCLEILKFGGMGHTAGMHTADRSAAVKFGEKMPTARVIINSPTTHGAIGLSTDLSPSMTLGCGSWGGNVTSDNVSPRHLMDIKRVAFETKPINAAKATTANIISTISTPTDDKRGEIAAIVDRFIGSKAVKPTLTSNNSEPKPTVNTTTTNEPPRTVIHHVFPEPKTDVGPPKPVDFVSESDVRDAINKGGKIYITKKTIVTPSARDLGNEREIFAIV